MTERSDEVLVARLVAADGQRGGAAAAVALRDAADRAPQGMGQVTALLERLGERLNPILVKETRQAMKSRQFSITFVLVLACCWLWTLFGVALIGPSIYYSSSGASLFYGYYLILAFALLVIVPFGAFRSLAGEHEDRTYELLSITTLRPRQIVSGKLGSAMAQMAVYLSAVAPCLAFTYLLRGIDLPTIFFSLFYTVLTSIGLCGLAMLIATISHEKHWQVMLSVLVIAGLIGTLIVAAITASTLLYLPVSFALEPGFGVFNAVFLTFFLSSLALVLTATSSQLTFAADNRATRLRVVMLVQSALFVGWLGWAWMFATAGDIEVLTAMVIGVAAYFFVMGAFMTGEQPQLSPRVRRSLPQSFLGRVFLTWFNPGPGTGYVFAMSNVAAAVLLVAFLVAVDPHMRYFDRTGAALGEAMRQELGVPDMANAGTARAVWRAGQVETMLTISVLALSYLVFYLGVGRLVVQLLRRFTAVPFMAVPLTHCLLVMAGTGIPLTIHMMLARLRFDGYHIIEASNPFWTLYYLDDQSTLAPESAMLLLIVPLAAALVLLLNVPTILREIRQVRSAVPQRVVEEEAGLAPRQPVRQSPWD